MTSHPKNAAVRKAVIGAGTTIGSGVGATVVATAKTATDEIKITVSENGVSTTTTTTEGPVWALFAISPMGIAVILGACAAGGAVATHQLLSWWDKRDNTM